ncbi:MAG: site-2 protease family protein, partial [bacterium]|nr:site-2 protease family protein [bacterium]
NPLSFLLWIGALIISMTIPEFSHALAADRLGDPTPRIQGRLTLNPLVHLDLLGTIMLIVARFGWGKPVQFDPFNLASPRRDAALISLAGPASNLAMALIAALIGNLAFRVHFYPEIVYGFVSMLISMNLILAVFNLIPIHPLDGGKILIGILPQDTAYDLDRALNQYGMFILLFLVFPLFGGVSLVSQILGPVLDVVSRPFFELLFLR